MIPLAFDEDAQKQGLTGDILEERVRLFEAGADEAYIC